MTYLGTAYTIKELLEIIKKVPDTATLTMRGTEEFCSIEIWYDESINDIIFL